MENAGDNIEVAKGRAGLNECRASFSENGMSESKVELMAGLRVCLDAIEFHMTKFRTAFEALQEIIDEE